MCTHEVPIEIMRSQLSITSECDISTFIMRGCLLIHGVTSTPAILVPLRDALSAAGYVVRLPMLAGHGGPIEDFDHVTWHDWYATVRAAYLELKNSVDKVYYAGISLGALLGLKLAADEGWGVRALALMSVPLELPLHTRVLINLVRYSPLRFLIHSSRKDFSRSIADPSQLEAYKSFALPCMPLAAVYQVLELQREVRAQLAHITNPLLLQFGAQDVTSPPSNAELVKAGVSSDVVETEMYARSRHILTMDYDRAEVIARIVDFFARFA